MCLCVPEGGSVYVKLHWGKKNNYPTSEDQAADLLVFDLLLLSKTSFLDFKPVLYFVLYPFSTSATE